jgi:hypothetical protein
MAARQALRLCEAEQFLLASRAAGTQSAITNDRDWQSRGRPVTSRAALMAAGLPPDIAAALRRRLQLIPERQEQS